MAQAPAIPLNFQRFAIVIGKFCGPTERRTLAQPDSWVHAHLDEYCGTIRKWLSELANGLGLCEADGAALHYTPHDFRRLFITDIVNAGFPIHLAAKIVGHNNIEVTRACTAVYQRTCSTLTNASSTTGDSLARPPSTTNPPKPSGMTSSSTSASAKSRSVTATAHMDQTMRMSTRASAATSARLIRQSGRLDEIRDNLRLQVEEAQRDRWLGDVAQLRLTIQHANRKAEKLMVRSRGNPELVVAESPA